MANRTLKSDCSRSHCTFETIITSRAIIHFHLALAIFRVANNSNAVVLRVGGNPWWLFNTISHLRTHSSLISSPIFSSDLFRVPEGLEKMKFFLFIIFSLNRKGRQVIFSRSQVKRTLNRDKKEPWGRCWWSKKEIGLMIDWFFFIAAKSRARKQMPLSY